MTAAGNVSAMLHPAAEQAAIGASAQRKAALRLLPIIGIGYGLAFIDRINISFASLRMNSDLHFSATVYGLGAGLFFIGYAVCEVPSNLMLLRFGARRWLARIMFTWGILATAMMLVRTPWEFYGVRLLLGIAEAGFFPGVIYYLTLWFPARVRARAVSRFYIALPLSSAVMGSLAGWLLGLNGRLGLTGWQWLFLAEGIPPILYSLVILRALPDGPAQARWLTQEEKTWIARQLDADNAQAHLGREAGVLQALLSPKVWIMGLFFLGALTCSYAYGFSAPAILQAVTGWSVSNVGYLTAAMGIAGAASNAVRRGQLRPDRRSRAALHCAVLRDGRGLSGGQLRASGLAGCVRADVHVDGVLRVAGAGSRDSHGISGRAGRRGGHRGDEHHHHVQRIYRPLLDGRDEGRDGQLLDGTALADCAEPDGRGADVWAGAESGAAQGEGERRAGAGDGVARRSLCWSPVSKSRPGAPV